MLKHHIENIILSIADSYTKQRVCSIAEIAD